MSDAPPSFDNMLSERFIDTEYKSGLFTPEAEVEPYIHTTFEFPAVAYAIVRQNLTHSHCREFREYRSRTDPYDNTVAAPYMLAELNADIYLAFVAEAAFEIAAHVVAAAKGREQGPWRIAVGQA